MFCLFWTQRVRFADILPTENGLKRANIPLDRGKPTTASSTSHHVTSVIKACVTPEIVVNHITIFVCYDNRTCLPKENSPRALQPGFLSDLGRCVPAHRRTGIRNTVKE